MRALRIIECLSVNIPWFKIHYPFRAAGVELGVPLGVDLLPHLRLGWPLASILRGIDEDLKC